MTPIQKIPSTGIVLHSADACIGCQYCVWNCPYSVPQFNPERGVVGKCDMCHGRLTDGLEPACVNACPESAIEIEIVNQLEWRSDHAAGNAPGMPNAGVTISTTRITLPENAQATLERVDIETLRPEHPHWSLVWMTSLIQLSAGTLVAALLSHHDGPIALTLVLALTAFTLNISVLHLGRPAYAWRALKMWRRSWLSREVLLFGLFFTALIALTAVSWFNTLYLDSKIAMVLLALKCTHSHSRHRRHPCKRLYLSCPCATRLEHSAHAHRLHSQRRSPRLCSRAGPHQRNDLDPCIPRLHVPVLCA